jgi:hypothetical protein
MWRMVRNLNRVFPLGCWPTTGVGVFGDVPVTSRIGNPFFHSVHRERTIQQKAANHRQDSQPQRPNSLLAPIHRIRDSKQVNVAATASASSGSARKICNMIPSVAGVAKWQTHRT